ILPALAALAVVSLPGCKATTTPIQTLLDDPGRYDHHEVTIAGTVKAAVGVLGYGAYEVNDGTGSLMVVTRESGAPREGAKVAVEGEFRSAFTLGDQTAAVLVERQRRSP